MGDVHGGSLGRNDWKLRDSTQPVVSPDNVINTGLLEPARVCRRCARKQIGNRVIANRMRDVCAARSPPKCNFSPDNKKCMRNKSQSAAAFFSRHNSNLRALPMRVPGIEKLLFARLPINRAFTRCHEQSGSLLPVESRNLQSGETLWHFVRTVFSDGWNATIKITVVARRVNVIWMLQRTLWTRLKNIHAISDRRV